LSCYEFASVLESLCMCFVYCPKAAARSACCQKKMKAYMAARFAVKMAACGAVRSA